MRGIQLRQSDSGPELVGTLTGQVPVWNEDEELWEVSSGAVEAGCTQVTGFTSADIAAALASGAYEVCFPAGEYAITTAITQTDDGQVLNFQPGAVLVFAASGLGSFTLAGDDAQITGDLTARFDAASTATYIAIDIAGQGCNVESFRAEVNANVTNATLLRVSGDLCTLGDSTLTGVGEFGKGIELVDAAGGVVEWLQVGRISWQPVDDSITTRNYGTILRMRCSDSKSNGVVCNTGGRTFVSMVIDHDGGKNQIVNPQVNALKASWGLRIRDSAEFLEVFGGIFHQSSDGVNALAGSQGIELAEGSTKLYGTKFIGWDIGCRFSGSCDSCGFFGAVFANNKTANLQIDSGAFPVSALGLHGGYMESEAVTTCIPIHCKTGEALGMQIAGFQLSSSDASIAAIECDVGFGGGNFNLDGCRFPQVALASVCRPNTNTRFLFGMNAFSGSNSISTGAFANNACQILDPILNGLVIGTKDSGVTSNNHMLRYFTDIYTANFGNINAGATIQLDFNFPGVPAVAFAELVASMGSQLMAKASAGIIFQWFLNTTGFVAGTATNITGSTINSVAGGVRFGITTFG
jgi:hypothetical protein